MRSRSITRFAAGFFLLLLTTCLLLAGTAAEGFGAESIGAFTRIEGKVDVLRRGAPAVPVPAGDPVFLGDMVRTKSGARAEITFDDGSVLRVAQRSRIDIEQYLSGRSGSIRLPRGKVEAVIPPADHLEEGGKRFEIHTPNAVAGVRGTIFSVSFDRNLTGIVVREGAVYTYNPQFPQQVVSVPAGQANTIAPGVPPTEPRPATEAELQGVDENVRPGDAPERGDVGGTSGDDRSGGDSGVGDSGSGETGAPAGTGSVDYPSGDFITNASALTLSGAALETETTLITDPLGETVTKFVTNLEKLTNPSDAPKIPITEAVDEVKEEVGAISSPESPDPGMPPDLPSDTTVPVVTVPLPPASVNNQATVSIVLSANEPVSFEFSLDNAGFVQLPDNPDDPNSAPLIIGNVSEGEHLLSVRATDAEGNTGTFDLTWTSDFTAPEPSLDAAPAMQTNANSADFTVSSSETGNYSYSLDGGPVQSSTDTFNLTGLTEGSHTLTVTATDEAGNSASTTYEWTVDLTAPALSLDAAPANLTNASSADFAVSSSEAVTYEYTLNGSDPQPFTGTISGLTEGTYSLEIIATDGAGNSASTTYEWTVDQTPPSGTPSLVASPAADPSQSRVTASFSGSEPVEFAYTVDGESGSALGEGSHVLDYSATDAAGNAATGSQAFSLRHFTLAGRAGDGPDTISSDLSGGVALISVGDSGWRSDTAGTYLIGAEPPTAFSLNLGGRLLDGTGELQGFWLSLVDGGSDPVSKTMSGASSFRFLTPTTLGSGTGTLSGAYGDGQWQFSEGGQGVVETPLAFFAEADADFTAVTSGRSASYTYASDPYQEFDESYHYTHDDANTFGFSSYVRRSLGTKVETDYLPDGTTETETFILDGNGNWVYQGTTVGTWDPATTSLAALLGTPPDAANAFLSWEHVGLVRGEAGFLMAGLGGTTSLWDATSASPAPVTLLGELQGGDSNGPQLFSGELSSFDEVAGTPTVIGGGAFAGLLTGVEAAGSVRAGVLGLYVDPAGGAGFLRGALDGSSYPGSGMLALDGGFYREPVESPGWLNAGNFETSLWESQSHGGRTAGAFAGGGFLKGSEEVAELETLSLVDQVALSASPWGVFRFSDGGVFENPSASTGWNARAGGRGAFGAALHVDSFDGSSYFEDDKGYWRADLAGSATGGIMDGSVTGVYLARTHLGTLSGQFLGSYDEGPGSWQGAAFGAFDGDPLAFSSGVDAGLVSVTQGHAGGYHYDLYGESSDFYSFKYDQGNTFGHSTYLRYGNRTETDYRPDGTVETWNYHLDDTTGEWIFDGSTFDSWTPGTTDLATLLGTPPDESNAYLSWESHDLVENYDGHLEAALGGTTSLWSATAATPASLTLLGETWLTPGGNGSHLLSGQLSLFGPDYGTAYGEGETGTTFDGGAFTGLLAGAEAGGALEAAIAGIYLDPNGVAGLLTGSLSGSVDPETGLVAMNGGLAPQAGENFNWLASGDLETSLWQTYSFGGRFAGTLGFSGTLEGSDTFSRLETLSLADPAGTGHSPWGVFRYETGGLYANPASESGWSASVGGHGTFGAAPFDGAASYLENDDGYWLADLNGTAGGFLRGAAAGGYLTRHYAGNLSGDFIGSYDEGTGSWQGAALGTYAGTSLDFGGDFWSDLVSYDGYGLSYGGGLNGLLGGVGDLWATGSAQLTLMGNYHLDSYAEATEPFLVRSWGRNLKYDPTLSGYAAGIGGGFQGYTLGVWNGGAIDTRVLAVYIDPTGRAGILRGTLGGRYLLESEIWEMTGDVATTYRENTAIDPDQVSDYGSWTSGYFSSPYSGEAVSGEFAAGGTFSGSYLQGDLAGLAGHSWGIWNAGLGGTFAGTAGSTLTAKIGSDGFYLDPEAGYPYDSGGYLLGDLTVADWGSAGDTFSGAADLRFITDTRQGKLVGDLLGTFDPLTGKWQGGTLGTWETTPLKFAALPSFSLQSHGFDVSGRFGYPDGASYYDYQYVTNNSSGYAYYRDSSSGTGYNVTYYADGTTYITNYAYGDPYGYGYSDWYYVDTATGTWDTSQPLGDQAAAPPDALNATLAYENRYPGMYSSGYIDGMLGGTTSLWEATTAAPAQVEFLGRFELGTGRLFHGEISSWNARDSLNTTFDGGAFQGFLAGAREGNILNSRLIGLYLDPAGNAGFLRGSLAGTLHPKIGLFEMDGGFFPVEIASASGLAPANLGSTIYRSGFQTIATTGSFAGGGSIDNAALWDNRLESMTISTMGDWGAGLNVAGGAYAGNTSDGWNLPVDVATPFSMFSHSEILGDRWSGGALHGTSAGYFTDYTPGTPVTGIMVGETVGTFDPVAYTWEAVTSGVWLQTGKFLDLAATSPEKLQQLNIPAVEIGRASFSGAGSDASGSLNISLNDVRYFAPSTGERPSIWASDAVSGSFTGNPGALSVPLGQTGGTNASSLAPNLQMQDWSSGAWRADVTAAGGTVGAHTGIGMQGTAAGAYTGTNSGTLGGTAAGIVK